MRLGFKMESYEDVVYGKRKFAFLQLVLLVVSLFSFPYVLGEVSLGVDSQIPSYPLNFREAKEPALSSPFALAPQTLVESATEVVEWVSMRLFAPLLPFASAQVEGCCEQLNSGASCVNSKQKRFGNWVYSDLGGWSL